jgi:hypothetical protein
MIGFFDRHVHVLLVVAEQIILLAAAKLQDILPQTGQTMRS